MREEAGDTFYNLTHRIERDHQSLTFGLVTGLFAEHYEAKCHAAWFGLNFQAERKARTFPGNDALSHWATKAQRVETTSRNP